jgi:hypothetical protein
MDDFKDKTLDGLEAENEAEVAVTEVVKSKVTDLTLRSIAKVEARHEAYLKIYGNYEEFLIKESEKLNKGEYSGNTYKELGLARLVAQWAVDTEKILEEELPKIQGAERDTRKGFVEESLSGLPDDIKNELLGKLNEKKHEMLEWFAKELQLSQKQANERRRRDGRTLEVKQG